MIAKRIGNYLKCLREELFEQIFFYESIYKYENANSASRQIQREAITLHYNVSHYVLFSLYLLNTENTHCVDRVNWELQSDSSTAT